MISHQGTIAIGGIDTNVGKTYITGLLARWLLQQGHSVSTLKLVQTGCLKTIAEDIQLHRRLMEQPLSDFDRNSSTNPYIFPFPASPRLAARMVGARIDAKRLDASLDTLQTAYDWLLVEGAGGLLVPLNEELLLLDYFASRHLSLILVTSPRLGSINHTRLSLEAIKAREIPLLGLVYNLFGTHPFEIIQDTLEECQEALHDYGFDETIVLVPDTKESTEVAWQPLFRNRTGKK